MLTDLIFDFFGTLVGYDRDRFHGDARRAFTCLRCCLIDALGQHVDGSVLRIDHLFQLPSVLAGLEGAADSG